MFPRASSKSGDVVLADRVVDRLRWTVNFTLHEGGAEVCGCIMFEALRRLARASRDIEEIADRLFDRHDREIEQAALARYAAGDFADGVVRLDVCDVALPANAP